MSIDVNERIIERLESDVAELYRRTNAAEINQATINEKLNSMLITLGELKSGLKSLQEQPSRRLEKFWGALIGAIVSVIIGFLSGRLAR